MSSRQEDKLQRESPSLAKLTPVWRNWLQDPETGSANTPRTPKLGSQTPSFGVRRGICRDQSGTSSGHRKKAPPQPLTLAAFFSLLCPHRALTSVQLDRFNQSLISRAHPCLPGPDLGPPRSGIRDPQFGDPGSPIGGSDPIDRIGVSRHRDGISEFGQTCRQVVSFAKVARNMTITLYIVLHNLAISPLE
jgi:hypothetical protein